MIIMICWVLFEVNNQIMINHGYDNIVLKYYVWRNLHSSIT